MSRVKEGFDFYTNEDIIRDYEKGYSINSIVNNYFISKNQDKGRITYAGDHYVINNNYFTKEKATEIVQKIIYEHLKGD